MQHEQHQYANGSMYQHIKTDATMNRASEQVNAIERVRKAAGM